MAFKEEIEHLGLGQESGEWPTVEEDAGEMSAKSGMKIRRRAAMTKIVYA